jgi:hypothetical protein
VFESEAIQLNSFEGIITKEQWRYIVLFEGTNPHRGGLVSSKNTPLLLFCDGMLNHFLQEFEIAQFMPPSPLIKLITTELK